MAYSRYIHPSKTFFKQWLSHVDAYPLFIANAAGVVLVAFFGYRKMFKHPDNRWSTGTVLTPAADGSWDDDYCTSKAADWLRWMRQFEAKVASANQVMHASSSWTSTTDKNCVEFSWDRSDVSYVPSNDAELYEEQLKLSIEPSYLQKMAAMEEVEADGVLEAAKKNEEQTKKHIAQKIKQKFSEEEETQILNLLGKHADIFDLEYQIATANSELSATSNVKSFVSKLKSFTNETAYTPGALDEITAPLKSLHRLQKDQIKKHL